MRVFYAIEFDEDLKEFIYDKQQIVKRRSVKGNFSLKENLHLTLKFIGDVENNEIVKLSQTVDELVQNKPSFTIQMNRMGKFERGNQSIIWIGTERNIKLQKMHQELDGILYSLGYEKEARNFTPHITLGRQVVLKENEQLSDIHISKEILINRISLMESTRINGVLTYVPIYSKCLVQ